MAWTCRQRAHVVQTFHERVEGGLGSGGKVGGGGDSLFRPPRHPTQGARPHVPADRLTPRGSPRAPTPATSATRPCGSAHRGARGRRPRGRTGRSRPAVRKGPAEGGARGEAREGRTENGCTFKTQTSAGRENNRRPPAPASSADESDKARFPSACRRAQFSRPREAEGAPVHAGPARALCGGIRLSRRRAPTPAPAPPATAHPRPRPRAGRDPPAPRGPPVDRAAGRGGKTGGRRRSDGQGEGRCEPGPRQGPVGATRVPRAQNVLRGLTGERGLGGGGLGRPRDGPGPQRTDPSSAAASTTSRLTLYLWSPPVKGGDRPSTLDLRSKGHSLKILFRFSS